MIQYNNIFKDYLDNGIEKVNTTADNKEFVQHLSHHLVVWPHHHAVGKDKENSKVGVAFYASSKLKA